MKKSLISKILASMLVITLTSANFLLLGMYASKTYAISDVLSAQSQKTSNENVEFDVYFKNSKGENTHTITKDINDQDNKMFIWLKVQKGYIKNAQIKLMAEEGLSNVRFTNTNKPSELIKGIDENNNIVELKQIDRNSEVVIEIPIEFNKEDKYDVLNLAKENIAKLSAIFVSDNGKERNITGSVKTKVEIDAEANADIEQKVATVIPYTLQNSKGLVVQTIISTGLENNNLPVQETNLTVKVPEINGVKPKRVNVTANSTMATNGQDGINFGKENWNYDEEKSEINIIVKNEKDSNNIVSWKKNCKDEYVVTYIFEEEIDTPFSISQNAKVTITTYNNEIAKNEILQQIQIEDSIGQIVYNSINSITNKLSKGNLYSKSERDNKYKVAQNIDIANNELVDEIVIKNIQDKFVDENGKEYVTSIKDTNYTYYQKTTISKKNFENVLGAEGKIIIKDTLNNKLVEFNKDTAVDEEGKFVFNYEDINVSEITVTLSKPISEGRIILNHEKTLKGNIPYSRAQIEKFRNIKVESNGISTINNIEIAKNNDSSNMKLVEPQTRIEASASTNNLSTVIENENVEMRVVLKTNDIDCDLYKNPIIEIVLPNYIEDIKLNAINLLFSEELEIADYKITRNSNEEVVITIMLKGEETTYSTDSFTKGANIIVDANIKLKELTPTLKQNAKIYVTNQNVTTYENEEKSKGYTQVELNSVAPVGVVTTNTVSSYNNAKDVVTSISGKEAVGKLDLASNAQTALISMNIINNNEKPIENISILGRVPFEGNKDVLTNKDLETTLNAQIKSNIISAGIDSSKVEVYYSQNAQATKDLQDANNGWTKSLDVNLVKSYLIVIKDYKMETGEIIGFGYNIGIPENLNYNKTLASNYAVYYNEQQEETVNKPVQVAGATPVTLTTGEGIEVETNLSANIQGDIKEGERIKYTLSIKNIGNKDANNITVKVPIPEGTIYTRYMTSEEYEEEYQEYVESGYVDFHDITEYVKTIDTIKPNETLNVEFDLKVKSMLDTPIEQFVETYAIVEAPKLQNSIHTNTVKSKIVEGYITAEMKTFPTEANGLLKENDTITYTVELKNVSQKDRTNVKVQMKVPDGTTYKNAYGSGFGNNKIDELQYDKNTRVVTYTIQKIEGQEPFNVKLEVIADKLEDGTYERTFKNQATVTCAETTKIVTTNEVHNEIKLAVLNVTFSNNKGEAQITDNDQIEYYIRIDNKTSGLAKNVEIIDYMPEEFVYQGATISIDDGITSSKSSSGRKATLKLDIPEGKTAKITLKMDIKSLTEAQIKEVENKIEVKCTGIGYSRQHTTKHVIKATSNIVNNSGDNQTTNNNKYNISGTAWIDDNKNGRKDEQEDIIPGMEVILMNADSGKIVKDESGNTLKKVTNEKGSYTFENLEKGSYIVVFLYDVAEFDVTTYKKEGLNEAENSNAVTMTLNIDGTNRITAISDKLSLYSSNIYNINIGLYVNQKFDLRLDKTITKISETSSKETKEHTYNNLKVAKLDLKSKTVKNTTVVIEYKIKVTNEGAVEGYAKKIVDYIPQDMKFNAELNKDWYVGEDGNIYSTALANTILEPGQSQELTLLLTKTMTENNTGIVNNNAEIYESYNDFGIKDYDSTAENNVQDEDNQNYADEVLEIKTGEVYVYTLITLITICIFGLGIYYINKKVLRKIQ